MCDISKAVDRVWHKGLLHELESTGCTGNLLLWFNRGFSSRAFSSNCTWSEHIKLITRTAWQRIIMLRG